MILALGTPLPTYVKPWEYFDVDAVMVSAYYILKSKSVKSAILAKGIKDYLNFDGLVVLDSGVFQLINSGKNIDLQEIIDLYRMVEGVDIKLSFDYPDNKIVEQYEKLRHLNVEPIIPANQFNLIKYFSNESCEWIFVGRLAKALKFKGCKAFSFLEDTTKKFSEESAKKLWALGVGNYNTLPYIYKAGFKGSDTSSYRMAAAFGDILVPKKGTQHITGRKLEKKTWKMKKVNPIDIEKKLMELGFTYNDVEHNFKKRAIFNAYVLIKEVY